MKVFLGNPKKDSSENFADNPSLHAVSISPTSHGQYSQSRAIKRRTYYSRRLLRGPRITKVSPDLRSAIPPPILVNFPRQGASLAFLSLISNYSKYRSENGAFLASFLSRFSSGKSRALDRPRGHVGRNRIRHSWAAQSHCWFVIAADNGGANPNLPAK